MGRHGHLLADWKTVAGSVLVVNRGTDGRTISPPDSRDPSGPNASIPPLWLR